MSLFYLFFNVIYLAAGVSIITGDGKKRFTLRQEEQISERFHVLLQIKWEKMKHCSLSKSIYIKGKVRDFKGWLIVKMLFVLERCVCVCVCVCVFNASVCVGCICVCMLLCECVCVCVCDCIFIDCNPQRNLCLIYCRKIGREAWRKR